MGVPSGYRYRCPVLAKALGLRWDVAICRGEVSQLTNDVAPPAANRASIKDRTGVEMEAMTAAAVALLTIYDMCKAVDRGMVIGQVRLMEKRGGRSGTYSRLE